MRSWEGVKRAELASSFSTANMTQSETRNRKYSKEKEEKSDRSDVSDHNKSAKSHPRSDTEAFWNAFWLILLSLAAIATRFWQLNNPSEVVFDEVHFGKFGSYYIRGTYYFDVHPPLGKLMIGASGYLAGYNGSYLFDKISDDYISREVPYVFLRSVPALFGAALVPLVFLILKETHHSLPTTILGSSLVLWDNALVTQTRLILLDSFLIFFDILAVYSWIKFYKCRFKPYSRLWIFWLSMTGISISLATGVKMVGLFVVALIGLSTIKDLWRLIDVRRGLTLSECLYHFFYRAWGLIVLPAILYLAFFAVHFSVLKQSGPGDTFMSPAFQSTLNGSKFNRDSRAIYYNDTITLLHYKTNVYLHSHFHNYPLRYNDGRVSSQGQQVTGYPHPDSNNNWRLIPEDGEIFEVGNETALRPVRNGDVIRLEHINTKTVLLTHDVASPLTATHMEMTTIDAENDEKIGETLFRLQIEGKESDDKSKLGTIDSKFKLLNVAANVCLSSHKKFYGTWGFGQQEVNGNKNTEQNSNFWIIDNSSGPKHKILRSAMNSGKIGFFQKFFELQSLMLKENSGLTASHPYQSAPSSWPILVRGISFWIKDPDMQIYLIGNPLEWWLSFASIIGMFFVIVIDAIAERRAAETNITQSCRRRLHRTTVMFLCGWALHYLPFFIMGRALFLHHYLPALVYSFLLTANFFEFLTRFLDARVKSFIAAIMISAFITIFYLFAPFTYGIPLEKDLVQQRKWVSTWDFK